MRIAFAVSVLFGGLGVIAYLAVALFVPADDGTGAPVPPSRGRGIARVLGIAALAAIVAFAGFGALVAGAAFVTGLGYGLAVAAAVVVIGIALAALSFRGGAKWLIVPACALSIGVGVAAAADLDLEGGIGERDYRPGIARRRFRPTGYELGVGRLAVDLRDIDWSPQRVVDLDVRVGAGQAVVAVPSDVCVVADAHAGAGELRVAGQQADGIDVDLATGGGLAGDAAARLDADVDLGQIIVLNDDDADISDDRRRLGRGVQPVTIRCAGGQREGLRPVSRGGVGSRVARRRGRPGGGRRRALPRPARRRSRSTTGPAAGWSDALVWPLVLAVAGAALLWAGPAGRARTRSAPPYRTRRRPAPPVARRPDDGAPPEPDTETRILDLYRGGFGVALVVGAALLFLSQIDALGAARDAAFTAIVAIFALGADPRSVHLAARPQPRRRARRADPLPGAGRDGRPPPRLGPADADPDAEARRRSARGRGARPPPGARAARLAGRRRTGAGRRRASRRRCASAAEEVEDAHRVQIEVVTVGDCALDERCGRGRRRRPRGAHQRGQVRGRGRADLGLRRGRRRAGSRPSSAIAGPGSIRPRCPPTGAACASRSSAGCSATAGLRRSSAVPGDREPRSRCGSSGSRRVSAPPTIVIVDDHALFRSGVRSEVEGLVEVLAEAGSVEEAVRGDRASQARRRPARRPHAGRRRGRGDPPASPRSIPPSASSRSRSPTPPRT